MTEIRDDHVEWAVVDRLRSMLELPTKAEFEVTHTYAMFTATLCWVMQHIRIRERDSKTDGDKLARSLMEKLINQSASDSPWNIPAIENIAGLRTPVAVNFEQRSAAQILEALRNATAHGDARCVRPFHTELSGKPDRQLTGFTFICHEKKDREIVWKGKIILREEDMRRIGLGLARLYCSTLSKDSNFVEDARNHVLERAA